MALVIANYGAFTKLTGTIAEVVTEINRQQKGPLDVLFYTDDATNARAIYHGRPLA